MKVLICGGAKTKNIVVGLEKKFGHIGVEFIVVNDITKIEEIYGKGEYYDRALICEQGITNDGLYREDEEKIRNNVCSFAISASMHNQNGANYVFLTADMEVAEIIHEELLPLRNESLVVVKASPYSIGFFASLIATDLDKIDETIVFKPVTEEDVTGLEIFESNVKEAKENNKKEDEYSFASDSESLEDFALADIDDNESDSLELSGAEYKEIQSKKLDGKKELVEEAEEEELEAIEDDEEELEVELDDEEEKSLEDESEPKKVGEIPTYESFGPVIFDELKEEDNTLEDDEELEVELDDDDELEVELDEDDEELEVDEDATDESDSLAGEVADYHASEESYDEDEQLEDERTAEDEEDYSAVEAETEEFEDEIFDEEDDIEENYDTNKELGEVPNYSNEIDNTSEISDDDFELDGKELEVEEDEAIEEDEVVEDDEDELEVDEDEFEIEEENNIEEVKSNNKKGMNIMSGVNTESFNNYSNSEAARRTGKGFAEVDDVNFKKTLNVFANRGTMFLVTGVHGSGVTTVGFNLANTLSRLGYKTLVIDCDTEIKSMSYASKEVYESIDPTSSCLREAINGNNISDFATIVRPNFHVLVDGIATDTYQFEREIHKDRLTNFAIKLKQNYQFIVFAMSSKLATDYCGDITYMCDDIIYTMKCGQYGLTKALLDLCNIDDDAMQRQMFQKSSILYNQTDTLRSLFGYKVKNVNDIAICMDKYLRDLVGDAADELKFSRMKLLGYLPDIDNYMSQGLFNGKCWSDTEAGRVSYIGMIKSILFKK